MPAKLITKNLYSNNNSVDTIFKYTFHIKIISDNGALDGLFLLLVLPLRTINSGADFLSEL